MDKELILENQYITVWYHKDTKIVHHQFHTFTHGEELQKGLNTGLEVMKKYKTTKWLSDDSKNPVMSQEDIQWTAKDWRPRVIKAGWKYWALVMPEKTAGQMVMGKIIKEYADTGVTVQIFSDPDEAIKWLKSQ
jgi:hypothetical protein